MTIWQLKCFTNQCLWESMGKGAKLDGCPEGDKGLTVVVTEEEEEEERQRRSTNNH